MNKELMEQISLRAVCRWITRDKDTCILTEKQKRFLLGKGVEGTVRITKVKEDVFSFESVEDGEEKDDE